MTVDEQIKAAQLEKLQRELAMMPRTKFSLDLVSRLLIPVLAVAAAVCAFWIGLPKAQLDLANAQRNIIDSEQKLAEAEKKLGDVAIKREGLLADIALLQSNLENTQKQTAGIARSLNSLRQDTVDPQARDEIDRTLNQVKRVDTSLAAAGTKLSVAATTASNLGVKPPAYRGYKVDVFHCAEAGPAAKARAEAAIAMSRGKTTERPWRLRELSAETNRSRDYNIHDDRIRFNADERTAAQALREDVRAEQGLELRANEITYSTPNYISLFLCAEK